MNGPTSSKTIAASYRAKAASFRKAATEVEAPAAQEALLRLAARWENRADQIEGIEVSTIAAS